MYHYFSINRYGDISNYGGLGAAIEHSVGKDGTISAPRGNIYKINYCLGDGYTTDSNIILMLENIERLRNPGVEPIVDLAYMANKFARHIMLTIMFPVISKFVVAPVDTGNSSVLAANTSIQQGNIQGDFGTIREMWEVARYDKHSTTYVRHMAMLGYLFSNRFSEHSRLAYLKVAVNSLNNKRSFLENFKAGDPEFPRLLDNLNLVASNYYKSFISFLCANFRNSLVTTTATKLTINDLEIRASPANENAAVILDAALEANSPVVMGPMTVPCAVCRFTALANVDGCCLDCLNVYNGGNDGLLIKSIPPPDVDSGDSLENLGYLA